MVPYVLTALMLAGVVVPSGMPVQEAATPTAPAPVAETTADGAPPQRVRSVLLYGDEACPKPTGPDEVVICARQGDSPYRIPKDLRKSEPTPPSTSWTRRAELVDEVNRQLLPGSCNPIGSNGQTGCTAEMLRQWRAERKAKAEADAAIPRREMPEE